MREFEPPIYYSHDDRVGGFGRDRLTPGPNQIEIGTSIYNLSQEAQKYLFPAKLADFSQLWMGDQSYPAYGNERSYIVVRDPHSNASGQFRLYKGLEVFFRDNPGLVGKTTFLAEGFPSNQLISVQPLIEQEPHPSDELIREVLGSFLITGYMAYEWKHKQGIPIVGIEDPYLYACSRDYALLTNEHPGGSFFNGPIKEMDRAVQEHYPSLWQALQKIKRESPNKILRVSNFLSIMASPEPIWNIRYGAVWNFFIDARNLEIARTFFQKIREYDNPILFNDHVPRLSNDLDFDILKILITRSGQDNPFSSEVQSRCQNAVSKGIYHYLKDAKIGFTFLDPEKLGDKNDNSGYNKLFLSQQGVDRQGMSYEQYLEWLMSQRGMSRGTTVRPDSHAAAEFVKKLKEMQKVEQSRVVYERKAESTEERPHWTITSSEEVWEAVQKESIWNQPSMYQGRDYEQLRVANLGSNCPVIDDIVIDAQTATSMKTMDLKAPSYQNVQAIESVVSRYIDKLSGFTRGDWNGNHFERGVNFQDRILEIGIPAGSATAQQISKLVELQEYAQTKDITLVINEVP